MTGNSKGMADVKKSPGAHRKDRKKKIGSQATLGIDATSQMLPLYSDMQKRTRRRGFALYERMNA